MNKKLFFLFGLVVLPTHHLSAMQPPQRSFSSLGQMPQRSSSGLGYPTTAMQSSPAQSRQNNQPPSQPEIDDNFYGDTEPTDLELMTDDEENNRDAITCRAESQFRKIRALANQEKARIDQINERIQQRKEYLLTLTPEEKALFLEEERQKRIDAITNRINAQKAKTAEAAYRRAQTKKQQTDKILRDRNQRKLELVKNLNRSLPEEGK